MASWTLKQTLQTSSAVANYAVYDNSANIYFLQYPSSDRHVYQYNYSTDTLTQISNNASWGTGYLGGSSNASICYFEDNLYVAVYATSNEHRVYRWDGSGTSWTQVASWTLASWCYPTISTDGTVMVCLLPYQGWWGSGGTDPETNMVVKVTSNGTSWNDGSITTTPDPYAGAYNTGGCYFLTPNAGTWLTLWMTIQIGADPSTRLARHIMTHDGSGNFTTAQYYHWNGVTPLGDQWLDTEYEWTDWNHWREVALSTQSWSENETASSWTSTDDPSILVNRSLGFNALEYDGIGHDYMDWYTIKSADATWTFRETIRAGSTGSLKSLVRFTATGDTIALIDGGSNTRYIYGRDDPFEPPTPPASNRMWMYKTGDDGNSWTSRGVKTA